MRKTNWTREEFGCSRPLGVSHTYLMSASAVFLLFLPVKITMPTQLPNLLFHYSFKLIFIMVNYKHKSYDSKHFKYIIQ